MGRWVWSDAYADIEARLSKEYTDFNGLDDQEKQLSETIERIQSEFDGIQGSIQALIEEKREVARRISEAQLRLEDTAIHLGRFAMLQNVYVSDIDRLGALEEAGFLLSLGEARDCPLCGAQPKSQLHSQGLEDVKQVREASLAEITKIKRLSEDLNWTVANLHAEQKVLSTSLPDLQEQLKGIDASINQLLPQAQESRQSLAEVLRARDQVRKGLMLIDQKQALVVRREKTASLKVTPKGEKPILTPSAGAAYDFCQVVSSVLTEWQFPGQRHVAFDPETYDIRIDGKLRTDNGKGVRALTHAAFKIALLIFCHERSLPHPGFVILDTPLLTYRDPIKSRLGKLSADEAALAKTPIKQKFFEHLKSISNLGQFIIFENIDLPGNINELAKVERFSGLPNGQSDMRNGFFPGN